MADGDRARRIPDATTFAQRLAEALPNAPITTSGHFSTRMAAAPPASGGGAHGEDAYTWTITGDPVSAATIPCPSPFEDAIDEPPVPPFSQRRISPAPAPLPPGETQSVEVFERLPSASFAVAPRAKR